MIMLVRSLVAYEMNGNCIGKTSTWLMVMTNENKVLTGSAVGLNVFARRKVNNDELPQANRSVWLFSNINIPGLLMG